MHLLMLTNEPYSKALPFCLKIL